MELIDTYAACYTIRSRTDKMADEKDARFKLYNNFKTKKIAKHNKKTSHLEVWVTRNEKQSCRDIA